MSEEGQHQDQVPQSLLIALDECHYSTVINWWASLTENEQTAFLEVATLAPEQIAESTAVEDGELEDGAVSEWYEYIVNQDVRFYFDRSNPQGSHQVVYPIMTPISNAADVQVLSHLLTNPRRQTGL